MCAGLPPHPRNPYTARPFAAPERFKEIPMKAETHPNYKEVTVICSCGHKFKTRSTIAKPELHIEVCSVCHPYYTGKQKLMDTGGRIDKFKKRYAKSTKAKPEARA